MNMLKFTKMQGLGNDYIYIDCVSKKVSFVDIKKSVKFLSDRHFGVGGDGVILIQKSKVADFKMQMFNSDGSEAEMCGNGIRCVGKYVYDKKLTTKTDLKIETLAGIKNIKLNIEDEVVKTVTVDMGEPILDPKDIPVVFAGKLAKDLKIKVLDREFSFTCVSMGNPHAITKVDDVLKFAVSKYGAILELDKHFPKRSNIEFIEIIDRKNVKIRVWERGAGETLACGTGACAVLVSCFLNGLTNRTINVHLLGGTLKIKWDEASNHVFMTGSATTVFEGEIAI